MASTTVVQLLAERLAARSQHLAVADYALPQRRLMHRTTVLAS